MSKATTLRDVRRRFDALGYYIVSGAVDMLGKRRRYGRYQKVGCGQIQFYSSIEQMERHCDEIERTRGLTGEILPG